MELKSFLTSVYDRYPQSELQDVYKAMFQACLGPEHMLRDVEAARRYLEQEASTVTPEPGLLVEPLSDAFCRVHLRPAFYFGLTTNDIFSAFALSAQVRKERAQLETWLVRWQALDNRTEVQTYVNNILAHGCPAVHHSGTYRNLYRPAYRVVHMQYVPPKWL